MESASVVVQAIHPESPGFDVLARLLKGAADPLRLEVLRTLSQDSFGVTELCRIFDISQPAMSHHLKVLAEAGLVSRRREGTSIYYRRAIPTELNDAGALVDALLGAVDALTPSDAVNRRIDMIRAERAKSSQDFFASNAERFSAQEELIAPRQQYLDQLQLVVSHYADQNADALELGPGEGWLLPILATHFGAVKGVDNSPEMLAQAGTYPDITDNPRIELVCGDHVTATALGQDKQLVVANMVLHHTASPATVVAELARCLIPGGILLINELCAHDQGWVRDACGDVWLGFEPEQLSAWAEAAGLIDGESIYLALRNGFRVQMRLFHSPLSK